MNLLDTDGDGQVTRSEFGVYYKRLKSCSDAEFEAVWKDIDANGDGELTLNELCDYYGVARSDCADAVKAQKSMSDEKVLEALQLQSLLNEVRLKEELQRKKHAERLRALAALIAEDEDEEGEEAAPSPVTTKTTSPSSPGMSLSQLISESKRRGDLAAHHYE